MVHKHAGSAAPLLRMGSATELSGSLVKLVSGSSATHTSPLGIVSGYQGAPAPTRSLLTSWQSQPRSLTTAVSEFPGAQKV